MATVTTSDEVAVAVTDFGGDGPDLLLAHATGFHGRVWSPVVERLRTNFRCVAFDERGHGDSGLPPDGDFAWTGFARDALAVVDGLGLDRPLAAGHSGGAAALLLAEASRPGTFRSLYCFEPIVFPPNAPPPGAAENPMAAAARRRREVFPSRDDAFANFMSKPPLSIFDPGAMRAYVDYGFEDLEDGTVRLKCRGANEALVYESAPHSGAWDQLLAVTGPVTLACGGESGVIGEDTLVLVAERLAHPRVDVLAGLGHFGPMEAPGAVAESIARAFASEGA